MLMTDIKRESVGCVNFDEITLGVGAEAAELLGYSLLQTKQTEEVTDKPILKALRDLGIDVLNADNVKQYEYEHQREVAKKSFTEWLSMPISEWRSGNYSAPTWRSLEIKEFKEPIPEFALHTAIQIKKAVPDCLIIIEHLDESPDPFLVVQTDMGNCYRDSTERYYVEVWNEPKFEGKIR